MKRQIRGTLFASAAALVLGACASPPPARQISSRELSDFLSGYVRVASNGQDFFCRPVHFRLGTCYTRAQMKDRLLALALAGDGGALWTASGGGGGSFASIYTSYNASGH